MPSFPATASSVKSIGPGKAVAPAIGLFFLAPLVGEFLLGNLPITMLPGLVVLAPMYGGGALLIRETARRFGLTWTGVVLLGLAYGIVEETFVTQSLFNPNYLGLRLLDYGYVPALGMGAWWTLFVLSLHTIWSTSVPISLVETIAVRQRRSPWLGVWGFGVTIFVFVAGCVVLARMEYKKGFIASTPQFVGSALAVAGLIALAFTVGRQRRSLDFQTESVAPPKPLVAGAATFVAGALFFALMKAHDAVPAYLNAAAIFVLFAILAGVVLHWSRRAGWNERHRLGLAAGFLLTYAWYGFVQVPSVGNVSPLVDLIGNAIFATGALLLLAKAIFQVRSERES